MMLIGHHSSNLIIVHRNFKGFRCLPANKFLLGKRSPSSHYKLLQSIRIQQREHRDILGSFVDTNGVTACALDEI